MERIVFDGLLKDNYGGAPKKVTEARVAFSNDTLKLLFISFDRDIISQGSSYNDKLYEGDVVELFLTLGKKERYLELEVNPDGVQYAGIVENNGKGIKIHMLDKSPFSSEVYKTDTGWRSEWEIPLKGLEALGFERNNAYYNLYRQDFEGEKLNLYALNPTMKETFHAVESFIKLEI